MGNFQTCGPNEVLVVSGMCTGDRPHTVCGGRAWVWGCGLQVAEYLTLNTLTLEIISSGVNSQRGVPVNAIGVAQIKVNSTTNESLDTATQLFLGKSKEIIKQVALETLEGHQRAIIGNMTVEEMFRDKQKFSDEVKETASHDMLRLGLQIVSYTLKQLTDDNGYLEALGRPEIAETHARQKISEAENKRDADIRSSEALQKTKESQFSAELEKTKAKMLLELQRAENQKQIGKQNATADMAKRLQDAITRQEVILQEMQVKVVERERQIKVQEEEIKRKQQQLNADIIKPAEADTFRIMKNAEAEKNRIVLEAQAEAERITLKGAAEAEAIAAKANAEAEQLKMKAQAFAQYKEAALVDVVLDVMPKVAAEIAAPLNNTKKISMISSGDGEIGASRVAKEVLAVMEALPDVVQKLTGVDISSDLKSITNR